MPHLALYICLILSSYKLKNGYKSEQLLKKLRFQAFKDNIGSNSILLDSYSTV